MTSNRLVLGLAVMTARPLCFSIVATFIAFPFDNSISSAQQRTIAEMHLRSLD
jgi:hypothetical protein